jgi:nucleoside-diphosphate-sugar epimerase
VIVAVTGATGFIGRHLVASLAARGIIVRAIVRPGSPSEPPGAVTLVSAPLEEAALADAFAGADAVVHLAGVVSALSPAVFSAVNVAGTRAVAEAARRVSAHLVHISSLAAAGPAPSWAPRWEDDPTTPLTPYGRSKLEGERIVQTTAGLSWTILRPGVVYGPGDRAMLPLFRLASRGVLPLVGRRDAGYTFIHVHDMVYTIERALDVRTHGDVMFVGHPRPVTAREVLETIRAVLDSRAAILPIPGPFLAVASLAGEAMGHVLKRPMAINRSRYLELSAEGFVCHVDRLRERLGIVAATDIHEGFADLARWYRERRWI